MAEEHKFIPCLLERLFVDAGYLMVHDGQHLSPEKSDKLQHVLPPEEVRFFVHRLEKVADGKVVGKAWFKYNLRSWLCVDFGFVEMGEDGTRRKQGMALSRERTG